MTLILLLVLATSPNPGAGPVRVEPGRGGLSGFMDAGTLSLRGAGRGGFRRQREFTETLLKLRGVVAKPSDKLTPQDVSMLERLAVHWYPGLAAPAQAALKKSGIKAEWPKVACGRPLDLSDWVSVPSLKGKPGGACTAQPSHEHQIVYALDDGTCIQSSNGGEWGSTLEFLGPGKTKHSMSGALFHPAELVPSPGGFWVIESLEHLGGSGGMSFLSRSGKQWSLTQLESLPGSVAAYRVVGDRLHIAVRDIGVPESPCKLDGKSMFILSYGETGGGVLEPEPAKGAK